MIIFYTHNITEKMATLDEEEAKHCSRVLRKFIGDIIHITDGKGGLYKAEITNITKKNVSAEVIETVEKQPKISNLTIAIAPTKNISRYEWFLEKATEIGIHKIIPILTHHSERKVLKEDRCKKIILAAMKQSKNLHMPILEPLTPLVEVLKTKEYEHKYIAHCMEPDQHLSHLYNVDTAGIVLIGPEGDFSPQEVAQAKDHDWQEVSLGPSRLRTETAGIIATHIVSLITNK